MNVNPVTENNANQSAMAQYEQFLADSRLRAIDQEQQTNADNVAADFLAAQTAQTDAEQQFLNTEDTNNLAMLQALQNSNNLATLLTLQGGGGTSDSFTMATQLQAANAFLNVNTLLQETQQGAGGTADTTDMALGPLLTEAVTLNLAGTLFQPLGGTGTDNNGGQGALDTQALTSANNTIDTTLNLLFSEIQTNAIFGLLNSLNVNTAGNTPTTSTAP